MSYAYVVVDPYSTWQPVKRAFASLEAAVVWVEKELDAGLLLDEGETVEWYEPEPAVYVLADSSIDERWNYQIYQMDLHG